MNKLLQEPLHNEAELLIRCAEITGITFSQLAAKTQLIIPSTPSKRKGWAGMAIETALGTTAGNLALPDFHYLGIELKTIPLKENGKPAESTFVTSISLLTIGQEHWKTSQCYQKLQRVLWVPVEGSNEIPFTQRRIGVPFLWSPTIEQENILQQDWHELTTMISTGNLEAISASFGEYLQVRPKAANGRSLCYGFDAMGQKSLTLPRGFYLRSSFTSQLLAVN